MLHRQPDRSDHFFSRGGSVGNGTAVAGIGGDLTGGVETAAVLSNSGNVTFVATATGPLSDGAGDTIPFTQITTAAEPMPNPHCWRHPLRDTTSSESVTATNKIVVEDAKWTFAMPIP